jgi:hypothetical protein
MGLQILTANRLADGIAVWYDVDGRWNESIARAEIARSKEDEARLDAIGKQAFADNIVLDVALIDIEEANGFIRPTRLRERIRAEGPTIDYVI